MQETPDLADAATKIEGILIGLWQEVLGVEGISNQSDFFQLGGDSLQMMTLLFRISQELGVELDPGTVFDNPAIAQLALVLAERQHSQAAIVPAEGVL